MAGADAQRLSPRGRNDPSFLGGGAHLRPSRPGTGPPKRRHPRAAVESVRPDAGGPADGLGRATELPVTTRRDGRTEMAVLAESNVASRIPAQDLRRARSFYAEKLGLEPAEERPGGLRYRCGDGEFALFESSAPHPASSRRWPGRSKTSRRRSRRCEAAASCSRITTCRA